MADRFAGITDDDSDRSRPRSSDRRLFREAERLDDEQTNDEPERTTGRPGVGLDPGTGVGTDGDDRSQKERDAAEEDDTTTGGSRDRDDVSPGDEDYDTADDLPGRGIGHVEAAEESDDPTVRVDDDGRVSLGDTPRSDGPTAPEDDPLAEFIEQPDDARQRDDRIGEQTRDFEQEILEEGLTFETADGQQVTHAIDDPAMVEFRYMEDRETIAPTLTPFGEELLTRRIEWGLREETAEDLEDFGPADFEVRDRDEGEGVELALRDDAITEYFAGELGVDASEIAGLQDTPDGVSPVLTDEGREAMARDAFEVERDPRRIFAGTERTPLGVTVDDFAFTATDDGVEITLLEDVAEQQLRVDLASRHRGVEPDDVEVSQEGDIFRASIPLDEERVREDIAADHPGVAAEDVTLREIDGGFEAEFQEPTRESQFLEDLRPTLPAFGMSVDIDADSRRLLVDRTDPDWEPVVQVDVEGAPDIPGALGDMREGVSSFGQDIRDGEPRDLIPAEVEAALGAARFAIERPTATRTLAETAALDTVDVATDQTRHVPTVDPGALSPPTSDEVAATEPSVPSRTDVTRHIPTIDPGALAPPPAEAVAETDVAAPGRPEVRRHLPEVDAGTLSPPDADAVAETGVTAPQRPDTRRHFPTFDPGALSPPSAEAVASESGVDESLRDDATARSDDVLADTGAFLENLEAGFPQGTPSPRHPEIAAAGATAGATRQPPGGAAGVIVRRSPIGAPTRQAVRVLGAGVAAAGVGIAGAIGVDRLRDRRAERDETTVTVQPSGTHVGIGDVVTPTEVGVGAGVGTTELEIGEGVSRTELGIGAGVSPSEMRVGDSVSTTEFQVPTDEAVGVPETEPGRDDDSLVPSDYPLPGRDIPRDPTQDRAREPDVTDLIAGLSPQQIHRRDRGDGMSDLLDEFERAEQERRRRQRAARERERPDLDTAEDVMVREREQRRRIQDSISREEADSGFDFGREFPAGSGVVSQELELLRETEVPGIDVGVEASVEVGQQTRQRQTTDVRTGMLSGVESTTTTATTTAAEPTVTETATEAVVAEPTLTETVHPLQNQEMFLTEAAGVSTATPSLPFPIELGETPSDEEPPTFGGEIDEVLTDFREPLFGEILETDRNGEGGFPWESRGEIDPPRLPF